MIICDKCHSSLGLSEAQINVSIGTAGRPVPTHVSSSNPCKTLNRDVHLCAACRARLVKLNEDFLTFQKPAWEIAKTDITTPNPNSPWSPGDPLR